VSRRESEGGAQPVGPGDGLQLRGEQLFQGDTALLQLLVHRGEIGQFQLLGELQQAAQRAVRLGFHRIQLDCLLQVLKRLIGMPGDTIGMTQDGVITLNGKKMDEPYLASGAEHTVPGVTRFPVTLGKDQYWMMGDNRNNSGDSRYNGPITKEMMVGKALFTFWPFSDARTFH